MINNDPIIDRIREVRYQIAAQYDHDTDKLIAHYMELDKTYPPERFFRPTEPMQVTGISPTTSPEQLILAKFPLLSREQQTTVLEVVEGLLGLKN